MPRTKQQRVSARKLRKHDAWITCDGESRKIECHVLDVSVEGAKLVADIDVVIGGAFRLSFVPYAIVSKPCQVVWRKGRQIGVIFLSAEETTATAAVNGALISLCLHG